jgi:signal transduction histidine kinase
MIATGDAVGPEAAECARIVMEQSERMTRIIRQLLDFARPLSPRRTEVNLHQIVRQTFALLATMARKRNVSLELADGQVEARTEVDPDQLQQVLSNLVLNAIQAMPSGGLVSVAVAAERVRPPPDHGGPEADYLRIDVRDQGVGIAEEEMLRLFEPFFTTKQIGEGTGLGLSVSRGIIREHAGWIAVDSRPGQGTCFSIYLPLRPTSCQTGS